MKSGGLLPKFWWDIKLAKKGEEFGSSGTFEYGGKLVFF